MATMGNGDKAWNDLPIAKFAYAPSPRVTLLSPRAASRGPSFVALKLGLFWSCPD